MGPRRSVRPAPAGLLAAAVLGLGAGGANAAVWSRAAPMATARWAHTATSLTDGSVLVAGGASAPSAAAGTAESYDPAAESWRTVGRLTTGRAFHTATRLGDGRVLVVGGVSTTIPARTLASAELYDPTNETWTTAAPMSTAREAHSATLLPDGRVLVVGGYDRASRTTLATAEAYDPVSGVWTPAGSIHGARSNHTATLLPSGTVVVAGGYERLSQARAATTELYQPSRGWFTALGATTPRSHHTATLLSDGRVMFIGGIGPDTPTAELYDGGTDAWSAAGDATPGRSEHAATLLRGGGVLVTGGSMVLPLVSTELYDPTRNAWSSGGHLIGPRRGHTATLLPTGQVLIAGGSDHRALSASLRSSELYTPVTSLSLDATLAFPARPAGAAGVIRRTTIANMGTSPLRVTSITRTGVEAADFSVVEDGCTLHTVPVSGACVVGVRFAPAVIGVRRAALEVTANTEPETHRIVLVGDDRLPVPQPQPDLLPTAGSIVQPVDEVPTPGVARPPQRASARRLRLTFASRVRPPKRYRRASVCHGRVDVSVTLRGRVLAARTVRLDERCRFVARFVLSAEQLGGSRTVIVKTRFAGNRLLGPGRVSSQRVTIPVAHAR